MHRSSDRFEEHSTKMYRGKRGNVLRRSKRNRPARSYFGYGLEHRVPKRSSNALMQRASG